MPRYLQPGEPTDDTPHDVEPTPATKIAKGVTLFTRDGSKVGNAIVVRRNGSANVNIKGLNVSIPLWTVETDFGNRIPAMQESEIFERWDLGYVSDYDRWWDARHELVRQALEQDGGG